MNLLLPIGFAASYVILMLAMRAERRRTLDAFAALESLRRHGPLRPSDWFVVAALVAFLAGAFGLEGSLEARLVTAVLPTIVVWLSWLRIWMDHRGLLDAAIVFQDHVPIAQRPAKAFSPAPVAALSFRPLRAALVLLAVLVFAGLALGVAVAVFGIRRVAFVGAASYLVIGVTFATLIKRSLDAEQSRRRVLLHLATASEEEVFEALRRNPRSGTLLAAHADHLAAQGLFAQALLEYRAARLTRPLNADLVRKVAAVRRLGSSHGEAPPAGAIVRLPGEQEPRMQLEPLAFEREPAHVQLINARDFVRELLAQPDDGLILFVQGTFDQETAETLEPFGHLSPLVVRDPGILSHFFGAWRLEAGCRQAIDRYVAERDLEAEWSRFGLFTLDRLLVESRAGLRTAVVDREFYEREYPEWRRAGVVAASAG